MKKILTIILLGFISSFKAQFANNWYFGTNGGLNFSSSTPIILTNGQSPSSDYTSAISDNLGNLLFYTDGIKVWNKNHTVMPNGNGLIGNTTAGACALIVPIPCNANKYVIFHTTEFSNPGFLHYSVVDMSLNSGNGDVVSSQKNISLGTGWTEKLCAYYNSTGKFYWVVSHKWGSDQFVAFKVDATTIATTSVISSIGSIHSCGSYGGVHDAMGQLTISQDGSKIANALTCQDKYELFDFNINTGVISNSIAIPGNSGNAWGTAFSPDSKKLYTTSIFGADVFQYDLSIYNTSSIVSSKVSVYNTGSTGYNFGYLELGPNGKIYITRPNISFYACINSPNLVGAACSFSFNGQSIGSASGKWGSCRIAYNIPSSSFSSISLNTSISNITCNGASNGSATITPGSAGTYSYSWIPGGYTTATVTNLLPGSYTINVTDGSCINTSTTVLITQPSPLNLSVTYTQQICQGGSAIISSTLSGGTPAYTYSWSNGSIFSGINVTPNSSTSYSLTVTDANGCISQATTSITVVDCQSVQELESFGNIFKTYPNPTSGSFKIQSETLYDEIILTDIYGKEIAKYLYIEKEISINNIEAGIYFLQMNRDNKILDFKKVVISK